MRKLILFLWSVAAWSATTTVQQNIVGPDGQPASGTVNIRITAPCASGSDYIGAKTISRTFAGSLSVKLVPNDTCTPSGTSYTVGWTFSDGRTLTQTWLVPTSGSAVTVDSVVQSSAPAVLVTYTPTKHASTHASGGSDPVTPAAIGVNIGTTAGTYMAGDDARVTGVWAAQSPNTVLAGPNGGGSGIPSYRALVAADVPPLNYMPSVTPTSGTYLKANGTTWQTATPNAANGPAQLDASGNLTLGGSAVDPTARRSIDIRALDFSKAAAPNATAALATPTPYTGTELVHPDVLFMPSGWNGHRFWMVVEPYAASNNTTENPSVYYSDDGQTWATPSGLTNPVIPASPPNGGYNSDADITIAADGTMYMFYVVEAANSGTTQEIRLTSSTDGVHWSPTPGQVIISTTIASERPVSPAIIYDGGAWTMYYVDNHNASATTIQMRTASAPTGPWSSPTAITGLTAPSGKQFWHLDAQRINGRTVLLIIANDTGGNANGQLFLAWSDNGTAFTRATNPVLSYTNVNGWDESIYRSTFALLSDGYESKLAIWYGAAVGLGGTTKWQIGYTEATLRPYAASTFFDVMNPHEYDMLRACLGITGLACDNFQRADNATTMGTPTFGGAWTNDAGNWGLLSKKAYLPAAVNSKAWLDTGAADQRVEARIDTAGTTGEYIIFRWADTNNYWRFGNANTSPKTLRLEKVAAGSVTVVATFGVAGVAGDWLKAVAVGNAISVYRNGALLGSTTDSFNSTSTKAGLQSSNTTTRFSGFAAMAP